MSATITDHLRAHLEQVSSDVANYWNFDTSLAGRLKPTKVAEATRYLYRVVVKRWPGGSLLKYSADRGDMGEGTGMNVSYLTAGFIDTTLNFEITQEQASLSRTSTQSRIKIVSDTLADAFNVMNAHDNIYLFGSGDGVLSAAASTGTSTTLTFGTSTDGLKVNQILLGMMADVWDSGLTTKRAGGPYKITGINYGSNQITFGSAPTGLATTDRVTVANLDIYGPATPTSFASGWPGTAPATTAGGLGGDSFMHGLRYSNDATAANYYLGQQKSAFTELLPSRHNASTTSITFDMVETVKNDIIQRRGEEVLNGTIAVMHMVQQQRLKDLGFSLTRVMAGPGGVKFSDLQPSAKYADTFFVADIPCFVSRTQDRSRVDLFNPKNWGRVQAHDPEYYKMPDGTMFFPLRVSSNGNLRAGFEFKIVRKFDWVNHDPGAGGYIDNLTF